MNVWFVIAAKLALAAWSALTRFLPARRWSNLFEG